MVAGCVASWAGLASWHPATAGQNAAGEIPGPSGGPRCSGRKPRIFRQGRNPPVPARADQAPDTERWTTIEEARWLSWGHGALVDQVHLGDVEGGGGALMAFGSRNLTAVGLMTLWMTTCSTNLSASFLDSTRRGRSRVESHTFSPPS